MTNTRKIFCFDENGKTLQTFETKEKIKDFFLYEKKQIYFSNGKKNLHFFQKKICVKHYMNSKKLLKNYQKFLLQKKKKCLFVFELIKYI